MSENALITHSPRGTNHYGLWELTVLNRTISMVPRPDQKLAVICIIDHQHFILTTTIDQPKKYLRPLVPLIVSSYKKSWKMCDY